MKSTTPWLLFLSLFSLTVKSTDYQHYAGRQYDSGYLFCAPVHFTRQGMQYYLQNVFSNPQYVQEHLPYSMAHFIQFLEHGKVTGQGIEYIESAFRLFYNKIKATSFITDSAFLSMLRCLPDILKPYYNAPVEAIDFERIKKSVENTLYDMFLNRFTVFKQDPGTFINDASTTIAGNIAEIMQYKEQRAKEHAQQMLIRFLEITLLKIIWNPADQIRVWESVKVISKGLATLMHERCIEQDDLNDLSWSLVESFCSFLDLTGSDLTLEVIETIKEDIASGDLLLFSLEEQEDFIETRAERLMRAAIQTEAKIHAKKYGMVTDVMIYNR